MLKPKGTNPNVGSATLSLRRTWLVAALPVLTGLYFAPVMAQEGGGLTMRFGFDQGLESTDNVDLVVNAPQRRSTATTRLSFGLSSETRSSKLDFDASAALRAFTGPANGTDRGLTDPQISFRYTRSAAASNLELDGALTEGDIANSDATSIFDPDSGDLIDTSDETGSGKKRSYDLNARLNLAQDAPLSYSLSGGISATEYSNASNTSLADSQRQRAGITARLALNEVTSATLGLRYASFDEDTPGSTRRITTGFDAGLSFQRQDGALSADFGADHTPDGTRLRLSFGRSYDLPRGAFSAKIGVTRGASGTSDLTGAITYRKDLSRSQFDISLRRELAAGSNDTERRVTALTLGYSQELTPLSGLRLNLDYSDSAETGSDATTTSSLSASYNHQLTEDWGLNLGYRHQRRDETSIGKANSNTVFMNLSRNFNYRP